jgi:hypothetical protein
MATKKDLQNYVDELNGRYCQNTKNYLIISQAYGGYCVVLTGKTYYRGSKKHYKKGSMGSAAAYIGNPYHDTATNTLEGLYKADSRGNILYTIKCYERRK